MSILAHATDFIWRNARLLERARFASLFLEASSDQVRDAVCAYRNPDGGFGHALEPDVRAPASQPLHVEVALRALQSAGIRDPEVATGACSFLASVAQEDGPVPIVLPSIQGYPRAAHWQDGDWLTASLNPTAALVGLLWYQGIDHPWLDRAAAWCWHRLDQPIEQAHSILCALTFLQFVPERQRAEALAVQVARQAQKSSYFNAQPGADGYGLTPLQLAPAPDAVGRAAFPDHLIDAHLDDLLARQQDDGGWPISWTPPGPAAICEWRAIVTLDALITLRAYGRIETRASRSTIQDLYRHSMIAPTGHGTTRLIPEARE